MCARWRTRKAASFKPWWTRRSRTSSKNTRTPSHAPTSWACTLPATKNMARYTRSSLDDRLPDRGRSAGHARRSDRTLRWLPRRQGSRAIGSRAISAPDWLLCRSHRGSRRALGEPGAESFLCGWQQADGFRRHVYFSCHQRPVLYGGRRRDLRFCIQPLQGQPIPIRQTGSLVTRTRGKEDLTPRYGGEAQHAAPLQGNVRNKEQGDDRHAPADHVGYAQRGQPLCEHQKQVSFGHTRKSCERPDGWFRRSIRVLRAQRSHL